MQLIDFDLYILYRAVISLHKHLFRGGQKRDFCPDRSLRWFGSNQLTDAKVVGAIALYPHFQTKLDREEFRQIQGPSLCYSFFIIRDEKYSLGSDATRLFTD